MTFSLEGQTALVTGGSGGIGRAIAAAFAWAGAKVLISGTREAVLAEVRDEIGPDQVSVVLGNLSDDDGPEQLWRAAEAASDGPISVLVNNAGITRDTLAMRMKDEDWDQVLNVNLRAAFKLSRASLRSMIKARHGRIINISSVVGTTGNLGQVNYAAAKAGLEGMSKSLAREVAQRGITVNCVAPGFIATAMTDALSGSARAAILGNIPMGRMGDSAEVASACQFLASSAAGYVTGQTIHVNGGMAMP